MVKLKTSNGLSICLLFLFFFKQLAAIHMCERMLECAHGDMDQITALPVQGMSDHELHQSGVMRNIFSDQCPFKGIPSFNGTALEATTVNFSVKFKQDKDWVAVTWCPPEGEQNLVKSYWVLWHILDRNTTIMKLFCKIVPKNHTFLVLNKSDGWKYPQSIDIIVRPLPQKDLGEVNLRRCSPIDPTTPSPTHPPEKADTGQGQSVITASVVIGVLLIIAVGLLYMYKRGCPVTKSPPLTPPTEDYKPDVSYFFSYFQESEKYTEKVATIASILRGEGCYVVIDKFESVEIDDLGFCRWVEKHLTNAKKIVVFCSPGYIKLWKALIGKGQASANTYDKEVARVRYEIKRISDMYADALSTDNIICVNMDKSMKVDTALPPWMKHNILLWPDQKEDIIRRMIDEKAEV